RSQRSRIFSFGVPDNYNEWCLTLRAHDGAVVYRGTFFDREDADAFLFAIASGFIPRALWGLPTPAWPGIDHYNDLIIEFATFNDLTSSFCSSYSYPLDFNDACKTIHHISDGGGGAALRDGKRNSGGVGAGAYSASSNITLAGPTSYTV